MRVGGDECDGLNRAEGALLQTYMDGRPCIMLSEPELVALRGCLRSGASSGLPRVLAAYYRANSNTTYDDLV